MDDMRTFGRWLKGQRASLGLTQEQLADRIGYSVETIHKIEAGKRRPSRQAVELLAAELGVPPEERAVIIRWLRSSRPAATSRDDSSAVSLAPGMIAPVTGSGETGYSFSP
jgi:transcriptional regulator with XRE-family HTH domain